MIQMPALETERLIIRPFSMQDLQGIHRILDIELGDDEAYSPTEREIWLQWTALSYDQLARLDQPPYGDRAVVRKATNELIGACGYAPSLAPYEQLPGLAMRPCAPDAALYSAEVGLYYAISPAQHGSGFATEAATALVEYAFMHMNLKRIVATTTYDNAASIGVMRKLGMRIERNPYPEPPWLQIVGYLDAPERRRA